MRERVLALGGRFCAGPHADGAFRVAAALPCQPQPYQPQPCQPQPYQTFERLP